MRLLAVVAAMPPLHKVFYINLDNATDRRECTPMGGAQPWVMVDFG